MLQLRDYQLHALNAVFEYYCNGGTENGIIAAPTGCHAKGQGILMYDGSIKKVEDIGVGDALMGPDSNPRHVLRLCRGRQEMREIIPVKGNSWIVNKDHKLVLVKTGTKDRKIIEQSVADYEQSSNWHRHLYKLYRVGVNFPTQSQQLDIDPYFLGVFLGDGGYTQQCISITSSDPEVLDYCIDYWKYLGDTYKYVKTENNKTYTVFPVKTDKRKRTPSINNLLEQINLKGCNSATKFIPQQYKTASFTERLQLLAGLIDTDGHLTCNCYDYITKSKQLSEDILFLARSVGLAAYCKPCEKYCQTGAGGIYYRISISGHTDIIPNKVKYKRA